MTRRALAPRGSGARALALLAGLGAGLLTGGPPLAAPGRADLLPSALEPPGTGGLVAVARALDKLATHRRLLVIAAHPDDEDTALLALVARGMGGEAAYLSLSRGEGGQNLIGPELGVGLGLVRTGELVAAREIDGARQFFTRAFDFGYTRSLEETFRRWPREILLEDVVRVIRRFRPQVVVSIFPADGGGHGQHQAAGWVAHEGYRLAGDPAALPQLLAEGWLPWQPAALYRATWRDEEATTVRAPTGVLDPLTGRSIHQLAMASRSMHRSQDMGRLLEPGPQASRLGWVAGGGGREGAAVFAGIDTTLPAIAADLPAGSLKAEVEVALAGAAERASEARAALAVGRLEASVPALAEIRGELAGAAQLLDPAREETPGAQAAYDFVREKIAVAEAGLAAAAGIMLDATTEDRTVVPGEPLAVTVTVWNAGPLPLAVRGLKLLSLDGWRGSPEEPTRAILDAGALKAWSFRAEAPPAAAPTLPYFLERPLLGGETSLYDWSMAAVGRKGEPYGPPPLAVVADLEVGGAELLLSREVVARGLDQALGEVRHPLRAVPAVEVRATPELQVWPLGATAPGAAALRERAIELEVVSNSAAPLRGRIEVEVPPGWPAPPVGALAIEAPRGRQDLVVPLSRPPDVAAGRYRVEAAVLGEGGARFGTAYPEVNHPHIRAAAMARPAAVEISVFPLELPALGRVGYVRGAADRMPELLSEVGLPLEILTAEELAGGDLDRYDAIVVGSRAYETEPALARANRRLLDYVRRGGLLLVLYQQYAFIEGGYAPHRLEIARPHDRVTDEASPVRPLDPDHAVFHHPNEIGPADWEGWSQERGLYFASAWDPAFQPLLALQDPGEPERQGGLLVAEVGEGTYVYTGLAFFRQIPAGVPGAYRLFANLLALAEER